MHLYFKKFLFRERQEIDISWESVEKPAINNSRKFRKKDYNFEQSFMFRRWVAWVRT